MEFLSKHPVSSGAGTLSDPLEIVLDPEERCRSYFITE